MELQKPKSMPELKPKVKALYDAVLELLNENADVNTLTVSDITKRAGIGKGTIISAVKKKSLREPLSMTPGPRARKTGKDWEIFRALKKRSAIAFIGWQSVCRSSGHLPGFCSCRPIRERLRTIL